MRQNPFQPVYDKCNSGNSKEKLNHLPAFPRYIDVELTNTCNFKCLMCPTGVGAQRRTKGFMSDDVYYKIISEIKEYKTPLRFVRWGEPTLHPNLLKYLIEAKKNGILTHVNTNGKLLDEELMQKLTAIPLDSIKFSFQGIDEKSYREMRNSDYFNEMLKKIEKLYNLRGDRIYPFIHISTTITYETIKQTEIFKERVRNFADLVTVGRTQLEFIDITNVKLKESEVTILLWLKEQESLIKKHPACPEVFDKLSINWDGKVTACCRDYNKKMIIGDVMKNSLKENWNSKKLNYYRKLLADMRHDDIELCSTCFDTMGIITKLNKV